MSSILKLIFLLVSCSVLLADEINEFESGDSKPDYIPEFFNEKAVRPIIAGDFEEYWELWSGHPYLSASGTTIFDLYLMKTKYQHRTYEGTKIGTIPHYGADLRFIPIPERDILVMTNGRELEIYTLWGKKTVESESLRNYQYQFAYHNWLFINETNVLDLDYSLNSGRPLTEQNLMWKYDVVPWETLEQTVLEYVSKHCFTLGYHCIIDPDDGRLLMSNSEVVAYRNGLKMSVLDSGHSSYTPRHHFYMLEDDITGLSFYIPHELETFTRPINFPYHKRYMLFPNFKPADRFITTRRHQIFVQNNRAQFQRHLPTQEPCNCAESNLEVVKESQVDEISLENLGLRINFELLLAAIIIVLFNF